MVLAFSNTFLTQLPWHYPPNFPLSSSAIPFQPLLLASALLNVAVPKGRLLRPLVLSICIFFLIHLFSTTALHGICTLRIHRFISPVHSSPVPGSYFRWSIGISTWMWHRHLKFIMSSVEPFTHHSSPRKKNISCSLPHLSKWYYHPASC